jgi:hypothetical protein
MQQQQQQEIESNYSTKFLSWMFSLIDLLLELFLHCSGGYLSLIACPMVSKPALSFKKIMSNDIIH